MIANARFSPEGVPELNAQTIWNHASHNAFPDVALFHDELYGCCREGTDHMSRDGEVVIFRQGDGDRWERDVQFSLGGADLRDPKLSVTPAGQLLCLAIIRWDRDDKSKQKTVCWRKEAGKPWSNATLVGEPAICIWRLTWHRGRGYGVGYKTGKEHLIRLYRTRDAREFEILNDKIFADDFPNEAVLGFSGPRLYCLLRKNRGNSPTSLLGNSKPPYQVWDWQDLGVLLGGPNLTQIPGSGQWLAGGRVTVETSYTGLLKIDLSKARLEPFRRLPSRGDHGYPGFVWNGDRLEILYYSEVEGKTVIRRSTLSID